MVAVVANVGLGPAAHGQPDTCPVAGGDSVEVTISSPAAGAPVSDRAHVTGRVRSPSTVFQVELFVGDSRRDRLLVDPPSDSVDFDLSWETSQPPTAEPATRVIRVVACGGNPGEGQLTRGTARVEVKVLAPTGTEVAVVRPTLGNAAQRRRPMPVRRWVGVVMFVPALAAMAYGLGRGPHRQRRRPASVSSPPTTDA